MTGIKAVVLALVLAIANPLCCCLAGLKADDRTPISSDRTHSCCTSESQTDKPANSSETHARDICPHEQERDSQISQTIDSIDSLIVPTLFVDTLLNLTEFVPAANSQERFLCDFDRLLDVPKPVESYSQTYCVYTL